MNVLGYCGLGDTVPDGLEAEMETELRARSEDDWREVT